MYIINFPSLYWKWNLLTQRFVLLVTMLTTLYICLCLPFQEGSVKSSEKMNVFQTEEINGNLRWDLKFLTGDLTGTDEIPKPQVSPPIIRYTSNMVVNHVISNILFTHCTLFIIITLSSNLQSNIHLYWCSGLYI